MDEPGRLNEIAMGTDYRPGLHRRGAMNSIMRSETPNERRLRSYACVAGLVVLGLASGSLADEVTSFSKVRFPEDVKRPLPISIGMVLIDFARINAREESFDIQGYMH